MVAFTSYPRPRYFPMLFALVGDSTITSVPPEPSATSASGPLARVARFFGATFTAAALGVTVLVLTILAGVLVGACFGELLAFLVVAMGSKVPALAQPRMDSECPQENA